MRLFLKRMSLAAKQAAATVRASTLAVHDACLIRVEWQGELAAPIAVSSEFYGTEDMARIKSAFNLRRVGYWEAPDGSYTEYFYEQSGSVHVREVVFEVER